MRDKQMPKKLIDETLVRQCASINSPNDYQELSEEIAARSPISFTQDIFRDDSYENTIEQAKALLSLTKTEESLDTKLLQSILAKEDNEIVSASACYYLLQHKVNNIKHIEELALSSDPVISLSISSDTAFFLISFMGYSGNTNFIPLLHKILTNQYHFFSQSLSAEALDNLGAKQDEEEIPYNRSITVSNIDNEIVLYTDEKYTGSSNCPSCQFFPCRVNYYYSGGIQDCDLFNVTDPNTLKNIIDKRDWGTEGHLDTQKVTTQNVTGTWKQARIFMMNKSYLEAIPFLCSSIFSAGKLGAELDSSIVPLAWIYLSRCFSVHNESKLEFIALREAKQHQKLIPLKMTGEIKQLDSFEMRPEFRIENMLPSESYDYMDNFYKKINARKCQKMVNAFDYYLDDNIRNNGQDESDWFGMGECCFSLGEYHLAELFMRTAVMVSREARLYEKFAARAEEVHQLRKTINDIGLSVERRKEERNTTPIKLKYGFCLDTYTFKEINPEAKKVTLPWFRYDDYFNAASEVYDAGNLDLSIEILKLATNDLNTYSAKSYPLRMSARLLSYQGKFDQALQYINWAIELKPDEQRFIDLKEEIETMMK